MDIVNDLREHARHADHDCDANMFSDAAAEIARLRAEVEELKDPRYVRVPVELIETLRDMSDRHIRIGTVLTVDMKDIALHLDMLTAAQETPND